MTRELFIVGLAALMLVFLSGCNMPNFLQEYDWLTLTQEQVNAHGFSFSNAPDNMNAADGFEQVFREGEVTVKIRAWLPQSETDIENLKWVKDEMTRQKYIKTGELIGRFSYVKEWEPGYYTVQFVKSRYHISVTVINEGDELCQQRTVALAKELAARISEE